VRPAKAGAFCGRQSRRGSVSWTQPLGFCGSDASGEMRGGPSKLACISRLLDRREFDEFRVATGSRKAQRTNAFGNKVRRVPLLGVLLHEHQMHGIEHRPGNVPVEIVDQ